MLEITLNPAKSKLYLHCPYVVFEEIKTSRLYRQPHVAYYTITD